MCAAVDIQLPDTYLFNCLFSLQKLLALNYTKYFVLLIKNTI